MCSDNYTLVDGTCYSITCNSDEIFSNLFLECVSCPNYCSSCYIDSSDNVTLKCGGCVDDTYTLNETTYECELTSSCADETTEITLLDGTVQYC